MNAQILINVLRQQNSVSHVIWMHDMREPFDQLLRESYFDFLHEQINYQHKLIKFKDLGKNIQNYQYDNQFHREINYVFLSRQGQIETKPWYLMGQFYDGNYFLFIANCNTPFGFICGSNEYQLYYSECWEDLVLYGLSDRECYDILQINH